MPRIVRGALLQAEWTGDKESMIQKHEKAAHDAAQQGAQVMLFQELFYGPYFCQVQDPKYYEYTEKIPDGPTTKRMQDLARATGMVLVVPMYEEDEQAAGIYYNTAAVIDADGKYLGKYRKTHIPHVKGFWEKFYFRPGNLGYPVFETAVGKVGVYICYDRHFPEGARALGLNGAEMVFIPSATSRGLSEYLWRVEQVSHALANGYFVGTINRVGIEKDLGDDDFYGQSYFVDPRGQFIGELGSAHDEELLVRDMDLDKIQEVRQTWQFFRDRRPDGPSSQPTPWLPGTVLLVSRRPLSGIQIGVRIALAIMFALLVFGTVNVFLALDANSHSNSDTLRPFLLTMVPLWLVALWAARIVLRER